MFRFFLIVISLLLTIVILMSKYRGETHWPWPHVIAVASVFAGYAMALWLWQPHKKLRLWNAFCLFLGVLSFVIAYAFLVFKWYGYLQRSWAYAMFGCAIAGTIFGLGFFNIADSTFLKTIKHTIMCYFFRQMYFGHIFLIGFCKMWWFPNWDWWFVISAPILYALFWHVEDVETGRI